MDVTDDSERQETFVLFRTQAAAGLPPCKSVCPASSNKRFHKKLMALEALNPKS